MNSIPSGIFHHIRSKCGQVLLAVARGRDMTKLDVKNQTGLSMSTVLSGVETLRKKGLLTVLTERVERGGKPHSVINVTEDSAVFGVSYRSRVLTAVAVDLHGEIRMERSLDVNDPQSQPLEQIEKLLQAFSPLKPVAAALAVNSVHTEMIAEKLKEKYSIPCYASSNIVAAAYRAFYADGVLPICVIGVGERVKCAYLGQACRSFDLSNLPCPLTTSREGDRYGSLLSVSQVRKRLGAHSFEEIYAVRGGRMTACADASDYTRIIARSLATLADMTYTLLSPERIYLFGSYLTDCFFDRITAESECGVRLGLLRTEGSELAYGAALYALTEGVFNA